jgi:hypothetical protein
VSCETELETESGAKRPFSPFRGRESSTASVKLSSPERAGAPFSSLEKPGVALLPLGSGECIGYFGLGLTVAFVAFRKSSLHGAEKMKIWYLQRVNLAARGLFVLSVAALMSLRPSPACPNKAFITTPIQIAPDVSRDRAWWLQNDWLEKGRIRTVLTRSARQ